MTNKPTDVLRVTTLNTLNNPELYNERFLAAVLEAVETQTDVLLLQEVLLDNITMVKDILKEHGFSYFTSTKGGTGLNSDITCAIASRLPIKKANALIFHSYTPSLPASVATVEFNGHEITLISLHMYWGGEHEHIRLESSQTLNNYALAIKRNHPKAIVIAGGDFNTEPDADSIRFLKGKQATVGVQSAYWVDATSRTEWENYPTARPYGEWGVKTARLTGIINPLIVPERKLDYLMVHGWAYGRIGSPSSPSLFGVTLTADGHEISDHYGLIADFWMPEPDTK
jgi:endonuclease/exonuclease/phosphatase family metal-dependent hydrolase